MKQLIIASLIVIFGVSTATSEAWAHGGRTDKNGCHKDNKSGDRHCH